MLHYYDPHVDYAPPEPFASKFADNLYAGEIAFTDHCIGRFIQKLKDLKMYDSTLLIIAGDHGEMLGEHGEEEHTFFIYESAIKVPLIVKLPGQKKASTVTEPVGLVDIVPTVCSIMNIDIPAQVQGKDISPLMHGEVAEGYERYIYSETIIPTSYGANSLMSISTGKWKFIQSKRPELYDVTTDPGEEHNLAEKEPHRGRILRDKLRDILERSVLKDSDSQLKLDPESIRRLQSLGYVAGTEDGEIAFDDSKDDPKDLIHIFVQYQKAVVLLANDEIEKAKEILTDLIPQSPDFPEIYSQLAIIELQQGNYDQAVLYCKKLLELKPDDPDVYMSLSGALLKKKDYKQAIKYGLKAVKMAPDNFDAQINLAIAFQKEGDLDQAVNTYTNALRLSPDNAKIYNSLAGIFISQGKFDQALGFYRRSIKIDPNQVMVLHNLARIQGTRPSLSSRNIDEAIILAERVCKLTNYKQPNGLDTLAIVYAAAGKFPQAIETAQKAIDVATFMNKTELAQQIAARLNLYKQSMPYTHPSLQ